MDLPTELFEYIALPDSSYAWSVQSSTSVDNGAVTRVDIRLASQTWQSILWRHHLVLYIPSQPNRISDTALLVIGADGHSTAISDHLGRMYAERSGMISAFLFDVPNQPLFDDRIEDSLIAYTLLQHLDTGEPFWPLLLPMTKSAVAAMNVITEFAESYKIAPVGRFVVTGASKRGWTTWLTAAADARVAGIAPVVYDNLNLFAQMPHQMEVFDKGYSEQISDYTESGLTERMITPAGYRLARLIDPYTYRSLITVPKLIINGSNDPYWATDALNLYWDEIAPPKNVLYAPNQQHSISDPARVDSSLIEFAVRTDLRESFPAVQSLYDGSPPKPTFTLMAEAAPISAACWIARSSSRDFRASVWAETPMQRLASGCYMCTIEPIREGLLAFFGEAWFEGRTGTFAVSTLVTLLAGDT